MITKTDSRGIQNGKELVRLAFKSTDNKPTTGIMNGSTAIEVNTGKKYVFDEESGDWTEIASSGGGGGGGGSSDLTTAEVTISGLNNSETLEIYAVHERDGMSVISAIGNGTSQVILYKGSQTGFTAYEASAIEITGNASKEDVGEGTLITITGDCTITIS